MEHLEQHRDMKKARVSILFILLCGFVSAKVYKPSDIIPVHLQDRNRYTSNPDGILSADAVHRIDAAFRTIEDSTGIQALVAVVGDIDPADCLEYAHQNGETVGVGRSSSDNGLVTLLSTGERCVQFATGYGIEGVLPDAICKRIQVRYMNPYFADNKWDEGMVAGAEAIKEILLKGEYDDESFDKNAVLGGLGVLLAAFIFIVVLVVIIDRKSRKCPKCSHCGYIMSKNRTSYYSTGTGNHGSGPRIGGGHFGGGGSFGGSYGGGHFGGGGAGSRF